MCWFVTAANHHHCYKYDRNHHQRESERVDVAAARTAAPFFSHSLLRIHYVKYSHTHIHIFALTVEKKRGEWKKWEERERQKESIYQFSPITTSGQFFVYNSRRQRRIEGESKKSFSSTPSFSAPFSFFSTLLLLFAFQLSIFFSFHIPSTFIIVIITDKQADWLNIYRKDKYAPQTFTFLGSCFSFSLSLSLSLIIHSPWSTISWNGLLYWMYVLFLKCYPSSQYALSVCSSNCADARLT